MKKIFFLFLSALFMAGSISFQGVLAEESDASEDPDSVQYEIPLRVPLPGQGDSLKIRKSTNSLDIMGEFVSAVFKFGLAGIGIFTCCMGCIGGYECMMAGGDSSKLENAKNRIFQSLLSLVLLILGALFLHVLNPNFFLL